MSIGLSVNNRIILANAGSRKTTELVELALKERDKRVLITTYTLENVAQVRSYITDRIGVIPTNIKVESWFSFLLKEGARPYQSSLSKGPRVRSINFELLRPEFKKRFGRVDVENYYFDKGRDIYQDRLSDFVYHSNAASAGSVVGRLEGMYDAFFIDEFQDLCGWDLDVVDLLFQSRMEVIGAGDPRQATYGTNNSSKNEQFKGANIREWFLDKKRIAQLVLEERTQCYRCNQIICDFADGLFPEMPRATSVGVPDTSHDGIFFIKPNEVADYFRKYDPTVLRWNTQTNTMGLAAINIGASKGKTFPRVLIFPTAPMKKYLKTLDPADAGNREKFYVAVTRAQHSVAFVVP